MKSLSKAIAAASLAAVSFNAVAVEGLSTTIGAVSDYYFRGSNLGDAGAYWSLDYEIAGFFVGTWWIDDATGGNDGLETDFYLGYAGSAGDFEFGAAYNRYEYTYSSDFEHEIALNGGIAGFALDLAFGRDDNEETDGGDEYDYTVIQLSYGNGPYGITLGSYDADEGDSGALNENEYKWVEVSYSAEVGTFDVTATVGQQFDVESAASGESTSAGNNYLIFDISKGFDI